MNEENVIIKRTYDYSFFGREGKYGFLYEALDRFQNNLSCEQAIINCDNGKIVRFDYKNFDQSMEKLICDVVTAEVKSVTLSPTERDGWSTICLSGLNKEALIQMQKDEIYPIQITRLGETYQAILNVKLEEGNTLKDVVNIENKLRARYTNGIKEEMAIPGLPFKKASGETVFAKMQDIGGGLDFTNYMTVAELKEQILSKNEIYKEQEQNTVKYATAKYIENEQKNEVAALVDNSPVLTKMYEKLMNFSKPLALGTGKEVEVIPPERRAEHIKESLVEKIIDVATEKKPLNEQEKKQLAIEEKVAAAVKDQGFSTKKEVEAEKKLSPAQKAAIVEEMQKNQQPKQENYLQEPAQQIARGEGNIFGAVLEGLKKLAEWIVNLMVTSLVKMRGLSIQATQVMTPDEMRQKNDKHSEQELMQDRDMSQHMQDKEAAQKMAADMGVKVSQEKKVVQNQQQEQKKTVQFVAQEQGQEEEQGQGQGR